MDLVFVGGVNRSGSTLLQKILTLHSNVAGGPEFDFMPDLMRTYRQMTTDHHLRRQSYFYSPEELRSHWQSFIRKLLGVSDHNASEDEPLFFSEKTPSNVFVADAILDLFPSARFVYIYRDGRAVLNSLMQVKERYEQKDEQPPFDIRFLKACREWVQVQNIFDQLREQFSADRVHSVRYENLIEHPAEEIEELMAFLNVRPESQQMSPGQFSSDDMNTHIDDRWYTEDMYQQSFNTDNIDKWRVELSAPQRFLASVIMAEALSNCGYEVSPTQMSIHRRLKQVRSAWHAIA